MDSIGNLRVNRGFPKTIVAMAARFVVAAFFSRVSAEPAFVWHAPALSKMDSTFIIAATGEPRFKAQRDSCEKVLILGDTVTLDYLIARRLTGQTPRQRHYVEHLFTAISDSGKHHGPVAKLAAALPSAPDSLKTQLLYIGSELGDSAFLPVAKLYLKADSVDIRKTAVRSLGSYPNPTNVPVLLDGLDRTVDLERQERLWALIRQAPLKEWPRVLPLLHDDNLCNRQLVRQILAKACGGDWSVLEKVSPSNPTGAERLEWILLALEIPGNPSKQFLKRELPLLDADRKKFILSMLPSLPDFADLAREFSKVN